MKKISVLIISIVLLLGISRCGKDVTITLPFNVADVENIESYYDDGTSPTIQKKKTTEISDIEYLYTLFTNLSLQDKPSSSADSKKTVRFIFNLLDGTSYEVIYVAEATKKGRLKSPTENFDYFTSADLAGSWKNLSGEVEVVARENVTK